MSLAAPIRQPISGSRHMSTDKRLRIELPDAERGRNRFDLNELDRLNARLERNDYKSTAQSSAAEKREMDLARRQELERRPELRADLRWQKEAIAETVALAAARGEQIAAERSGLKRIMDHDPLLSLARAGHITAEQLETGTTVRELYDSRAQDAGAMEYTGMPSSAHDHERFVGTRFTRAKASAMIGRIERLIAVECTAEPMCLTMLREVCERGMSVNSRGEGRAYARNAAALAMALDVADDVLKRRR